MIKWKFLKDSGFSFKVSSKGEIERLNYKGVYIKMPHQNCKGYKQITFSVKGVTINKKVHRLVAMAFIPNPEDKPQVNHINGIKTDNRACNLEWNTNSENGKHAYKTGLRFAPKGEKSVLSKLTNKEVEEIYILANKTDITNKDLAKKYKVKPTIISNIKTGLRWSSITKDIKLS